MDRSKWGYFARIFTFNIEAGLAWGQCPRDYVTPQSVDHCALFEK